MKTTIVLSMAVGSMIFSLLFSSHGGSIESVIYNCTAMLLVALSCGVKE